MAQTCAPQAVQTSWVAVQGHIRHVSDLCDMSDTNVMAQCALTGLSGPSSSPIQQEALLPSC